MKPRQAGRSSDVIVAKGPRPRVIDARRKAMPPSARLLCTWIAVAIAATAWAAPGNATTRDAKPEAGAAAAAIPSRNAVAVRVVPAQSTLILGKDKGTNLQVTVIGEGASQAVPGRTQATVGSIGGLTSGPTPGTFSAEYAVPTDRRPQSAIVTVEVLLPGGKRAHGVAHLMLPAATNFPLRTSPNARVSLEIAAQRFGPEKADATGNVTVPIVVPPNLPTGRARAENRFGVAKEADVGLQPQDYPRVLLCAPPVAEAGSTVVIEVHALDPSGEPPPPEYIDLAASAGKVRRLGGTTGMAEFEFTVPDRVGPGAVALVASTDDGTSVKPETMLVRAGRPAMLALTSDKPRLILGSDARARLAILARDKFGNRVAADGLSVTADGAPLPAVVTADGAKLEIPAPEAWHGEDHISVSADMAGLHAGLRLGLTGGEPARALLSATPIGADAQGRSTVELELQVFDDRGTPTSARKIVWQTDDAGALQPLPSRRLGIYVARFTVPRALRDRTAVVSSEINGTIISSVSVPVEVLVERSAAARFGVASNLGSLFGQSAFLEAMISLRRFGARSRLFSAGVALGYLHSDLTTSSARAFPPVHVEISQAPVLALARVRLPAELPVEVSLSGSAGFTFARTTIVPNGPTPFGTSRGRAYAAVLGAGADAAVPLEPGELLIGARYLWAELGTDSNGDRIEGNSVGLLCDLGFRIGF